MSRSICIVGTLLVAVALISSGCDLLGGGEQPIPQPVVAPVVQPVQPVPVAQPVAQPTPPPPTPLIPIEAPEAVTSGNTGGGGGGVNASIPGIPTDGSELIGNYNCKVDAQGLPIGPFQLPPFGCRIFKGNDGSLKVGSTGRAGAYRINGSVTNTTTKGFNISGRYTFPGNSLGIKARMIRKAAANPKFSGKGRGLLNNNASTKVKFTLTMDKQ